MTATKTCRTFWRIISVIGLLAVVSSLILSEHFPITTFAASREPVRARHGIVASTNEVASQVGVDIMKSGGNAIEIDLPLRLAHRIECLHDVLLTTDHVERRQLAQPCRRCLGMLQRVANILHLRC